MQNLHVVIAVDRAGLVGEDGETHHGIFDVGFLRQAPNMTVLCPASLTELDDMLIWAVQKHNGPVAVRYPRGGDGSYSVSDWSATSRVIAHKYGNDCAIVTYGRLLNNALEASKILSGSGVEATIIRLTQISPLPVEELLASLNSFQNVIIIEECCENSGIYSEVAWHLQRSLNGCKCHNLCLGDQYPTHGALNTLYQHYKLDAKSIANFVREVLKVEN